jgi:hypothetical protein
LDARHRDMRAGEGEGGESVVKAGRLPAISCVAGSAVGAELAAVGIIRRMARITVDRRAFEDAVVVTLGAVNKDVLTGQLEGRPGMVKNAGRPAIGGVTAVAILTQLTLVRIFAGMTRETIDRRAFEHRVVVTLGAFNKDVLAGQLEDRPGMVKDARRPAIGGVTAIAILTQLILVRIIVGVTREAVDRRAFEDLVIVTLGAVHLDMPSGQWKSRQRVVNRRTLPDFGRMTGRAVGAQAAFVDVIFGVTGKAICGRTRKKLVCMALGAVHRDVCPG